MFDEPTPPEHDVPPAAYQLADHLDAALAAAEDLVAAGRAWTRRCRLNIDCRQPDTIAERETIERIKTYEAVLVTRIIKARKRARELTRTADDFGGMTRLFIGGTAVLADAVAELGDSTHRDFDTADCTVAYLRLRGIIEDDAIDLPEDRDIAITDENFLVAGRLPLAPLIEMVVAFLDALDAHYDLYPDDASGVPLPITWSDLVSVARSGERVAEGIAATARRIVRAPGAKPSIENDLSDENGQKPSSLIKRLMTTEPSAE